MAMPAYLPAHGAFNGQSGAIDGTWQLVDGYIGGVRVPEADLPRLTLTIDDGRFTLGHDRGRVVIDRHSQPWMIDIVATSGPNRGMVVPGIFECSHGVLRVCYDLAGVDRPVTFDAPPGARRLLALYRLIDE